MNILIKTSELKDDVNTIQIDICGSIATAEGYLDATDQQVITMTEMEGNLNKMTTMVAKSTKITLDKALEVESDKIAVSNDKSKVITMINEVREYNTFNNDMAISNTELLSIAVKINEKTLAKLKTIL